MVLNMALSYSRVQLIASTTFDELNIRLENSVMGTFQTGIQAVFTGVRGCMRKKYQQYSTC